MSYCGYFMIFYVVELVRTLLAKGADATKVTCASDTMLHGAVFGKKPEIVEMLIKAGNY